MNIRPVSDLRNYTAVLKDCTSGSPVFLTKNGRGKYVIMDVADYDSLRQEIPPGENCRIRTKNADR